VDKCWLIEPISEQLVALLTVMSHLLRVMDVPDVNLAGLIFPAGFLLFFLFNQLKLSDFMQFIL
jgi:hypothetical protein